MHRTGALFGCDAKRIAHQRRNARRADDLLRLFGKRAHGRDDVDDLETRLPALPYRFLAGDQHHRHAAEESVSRAGDEVERAGTECRERDPRLSRQPSIGGSHESRRLLMPGYDQLDGRATKAVADIEVLLAGHPKNPIDALILRGSNENIRSLHIRLPGVEDA